MIMYGAGTVTCYCHSSECVGAGLGSLSIPIHLLIPFVVTNTIPFKQFNNLLQ